MIDPAEATNLSKRDTLWREVTPECKNIEFVKAILALIKEIEEGVQHNDFKAIRLELAKKLLSSDSPIFILPTDSMLASLQSNFQQNASSERRMLYGHELMEKNFSSSHATELICPIDLPVTIDGQHSRTCYITDERTFISLFSKIDLKAIPKLTTDAFAPLPPKEDTHPATELIL